MTTALATRGLAELLWTIDASDYLWSGAATIASRVLSSLKPGAVILLHDGGGDRSQTVAALPNHHRRHPKCWLSSRPGVHLNDNGAR